MESPFPCQLITPLDSATPNILVHANGTLAIANATSGDAGQYLCHAANGVGSPLSKVITVTVLGEEKAVRCLQVCRAIANRRISDG